MPNDIPVILGLRRSFGFGDRLGLAGPGHIDALQGSGFAGILAQQSIREMTRTGRTPQEVIQAARDAVAALRYDEPWGADADHLKTPEDVQATQSAGFCFFTIDPSEHVNNEADSMEAEALHREVHKQCEEGLWPGTTPADLYLGPQWDLDSGVLKFDRETLSRAVVKYGRAIGHTESMAAAIDKAHQDGLYEIEVSVDETDTPTSPLEHLFIALELRRRGITVVSLAPRFIGDFEKGIDYKGDVSAFEDSLKRHVSIARQFGPYKISIHSGSDKFAVYPMIGRVCGELLHVKTAGTSYLEALRCVCRTDPGLFSEIAGFARERFAQDRASYHISTGEEDIAKLDPSDADHAEAAFLEGNAGRQLLHVTFGSVLTRGTRADGCSFKEAILQNLVTHADLHRELVAAHLGKHLRLLNAG